MDHTYYINKFIKKYDYKAYLEIGVRNPNSNFNKIDIETKEGCDVSDIPGLKYHMTSDEMFQTMDVDKKYDIIFIDGMHDESYVDRDIHNSLKHLNEGGMILLHDVVPGSKHMAVKKEKYDDSSAWNGDVYKSIVKLYDTELNYYTVNNNDYGLGVILQNGKSNSLDSVCRYEYEQLFNDNKTPHITDLGRQVLHVVEENDVDSVIEFK